MAIFTLAARPLFYTSDELCPTAQTATRQTQKAQPDGRAFPKLMVLAEEEGFEPPVPFSTSVFKTGALNRSAIPPLAAAKIIGFGVNNKHLGGKSCTKFCSLVLPDCDGLADGANLWAAFIRLYEYNNQTTI